MAKNKTERIDWEIQKIREKLTVYQEKLKTLQAQKTEMENVEIVQMVRTLRMTPAELRVLLNGSTTSCAVRSATHIKQEDSKDEE